MRNIEFNRPLEARQERSAKFGEVGDVAVLITIPRTSLVNGANCLSMGELG